MGKASFAKLKSSSSAVLKINFDLKARVEGFDLACLLGLIFVLAPQILNAEMITSIIIRERVTKCFFLISFLTIIYQLSKTFGRMCCKGTIYRSDYQILSFKRLFKKLVFGSKTALICC